MKKILHQTYMLIVFVVFWFNDYSQIRATDSLKIDSLKRVLITKKEDTDKVNTLNELSKLVVQDRNNAMQYAKQALVLSQKLNFKNGEGVADYNYAVALAGSSYIGERGNFDDVMKYYNEAINIFKTNGNQIALADCYTKLGNAYYSFKQDAGEDIKNTLTALKIYEANRNKPGIANSLQSLGQIYYEMGNDSTAIKYSSAALKMLQQIPDSAGIANMSNMLGSLYLNKDEYNQSLEKYFFALKIYQSQGDRAVDYGIPFTYGNIGQLYNYQGDVLSAKGDKNAALKKFSEALKYFQLRLKLEEKGKLSPRVTLLQLGYCYVGISNASSGKEKKANLLKGQAYYEKALTIAKETNQKGMLQNINYSLAVTDTLSGDYKQAYEHYKSYVLYRDSLINEENTKKTVQAEMQYDFDKKETAAKSAQVKKDAEANRIRNQQYFIIAALGIVVLAVIIIALIQYRNNKHKQKANLLLQEQKEKVESTLSELKSTQAQLIQSEKMASLGELTAGIAHEIQNPLNFVNNFSEVNKELLVEMKDEMNKGNIDDANAIANDVIDNEEKINHHGKRAEAIVKGMLQHSRATSSQKEPTDINKLADEYLRLSYHGLRAKDKTFNATLQTDFDNNIAKINIVPQDIGRVLLNLYNNAFYAVSEKKKQQNENYEPIVSVSTKKINDKVEIRVKDNGNGIPQKIVDKIFQPFFTTKPTGQGTGLGLSLSYDIIKAHGGEIKVETKGGKGSEFIVTLTY